MSGRDAAREPRGRRRLRPRAAGMALLAALIGIALPVRAQEDDARRVPRIPAGTPVVLAPVQSVRPTPSGGWPGGADSRQAALRQINAEVDFAVSEAPMASSWASPRTVVARVERNPMLKVKPRQLAYRGLLAEREGEFLYDPLHGQLRKLTALMDARLVILPLVVWYEQGERGKETFPGDSGVGAQSDTGAVTPPGRARMRVALVDTRRGAVLWQGDVAGDEAPSGSPATIATLAANLVEMLTES